MNSRRIVSFACIVCALVSLAGCAQIQAYMASKDGTQKSAGTREPDGREMGVTYFEPSHRDAPDPDVIIFDLDSPYEPVHRPAQRRRPGSGASPGLLTAPPEPIAARAPEPARRPLTGPLLTGP